MTILEKCVNVFRKCYVDPCVHCYSLYYLLIFCIIYVLYLKLNTVIAFIHKIKNRYMCYYLEPYFT
jgi:hypothetical protein